MERMASSYFQEVYTKDPTISPTVMLDCITSKVTADMNISLCAPFTKQEVSDALFLIGPLKAPGVDGLPARFYQRNWTMLKVEIIAAVLRYIFFLKLGLCQRERMLLQLS